jgi:hypothetical protein
MGAGGHRHVHTPRQKHRGRMLQLHSCQIIYLAYHTRAVRGVQVFLCRQRHDTRLFPRSHRLPCFQPMKNQPGAGSTGTRRRPAAVLHVARLIWTAS